MSTDSAQRAALRQYVDSWNAKDVDAVMALFAADAVLRDPYGAEPVVGREAIRQRLEPGRDMLVDITLDAPIRGSHGDRAAAAFTLRMRVEGEVRRVKTIVVATFDDHGKITAFDSHWGASDME